MVSCGNQEKNQDESHTAVEESHEGHLHAETTFEPGKGVMLSEHGRASLELETSAVHTDAASISQRVSVQVYRRADEASVPAQSFRPGYAYASVIVPAAEAEGWELGQQAEADAKVKLLKIDWQLKPVTGQAEAIVEIHDPEVQLAIGDFVEVPLSQDATQYPDLVSIPESAVLKTAKGDFAYAANRKYFFRTPVKVEGIANGQALISDGVYEGDVVASRGVSQLYQIELQVINGGQGCAHGH